VAFSQTFLWLGIAWSLGFPLKRIFAASQSQWWHWAKIPAWCWKKKVGNRGWWGASWTSWSDDVARAAQWPEDLDLWSRYVTSTLWAKTLLPVNSFGPCLPDPQRNLSYPLHIYAPSTTTDETNPLPAISRVATLTSNVTGHAGLVTSALDGVRPTQGVLATILWVNGLYCRLGFSGRTLSSSLNTGNELLISCGCEIEFVA